MKLKRIFIISIVLIIFIILSNTVQANLLAECNICETSGKCTLCNGSKTNICDRCKGTKKMECDQCTDGHVECSICHGSKIVKCECSGESPCPNCGGTTDKTCPQCSGSGKNLCNACKGEEYVKCTGCSGTGNVKCVRCNGNGKCLSCKGTGYLSGNNDGVNNVPKNGDLVQLLNGKTITWGSSNSTSSNNTNTTTNNTTTNNTNTATKNTTTNNTSTNQTQEKIEEQQEEKNIITEENKSQIVIGNDAQSATAKFDVNDMKQDETEKFNSISNEELTEIVQKLDTIISSAKIGEVSEESNSIIETVLEKNNLKEDSSVKLCKINFDGHISIDFPVKVSINVDPNIFIEEDVIIGYHILEDGTVESLGEIQKYADNGKVTRIEFNTNSFSDFFLTTERLNLNIEEEEQEEKQEEKIENNQVQQTINWAYIVYAVILIIVIIVIIIVIKKCIKGRNSCPKE